jgi:hypothetical protein
LTSNLARVQVERVASISDPGPKVDELEDPPEQRERRLNIDGHLQQLVDRDQ